MLYPRSCGARASAAGLGSRLLQELTDLLGTRVVLEAELPNTDTARRRLDFYRRSGFTVLPYSYVQPAYAPDRASVPMRLLSIGGSVSPEEFRQIREALYAQVYGLPASAQG